MASEFETFLADAIQRGETDYHYGSPANAQHLLIEFNRRISGLIEQHRLQPIGEAIWYLYGCLSNTTHDALDSSVNRGFPEFYQSLQLLYDNGFASYCENRAQHSSRNPNSFATACYMLWDMDGGLTYYTFYQPGGLPYGQSLIDFGLSHNHAAVQESFLHCLGHLRDDDEHAAFVEEKISKFLRRRDLDPGIRDYAEACQQGGIL